jgi:hypothetical protein
MASISDEVGNDASSRGALCGRARRGSGVFEYNNASKATEVISNVGIPDWVAVLPVALIAYVVFLSTFQYLLANDEQ